MVNCQQHIFTKQMFYLKYFCFFQVFQSEGMDSVSLISPPSPPLTYVCLLIYSIHGHKTYLTQMLLFNKHFGQVIFLLILLVFACTSNILLLFAICIDKGFCVQESFFLANHLLKQQNNLDKMIPGRRMVKMN